MSSPLLQSYNTKNFNEFENLLASGKIRPDINLGLGQTQNQNLLMYISNHLTETPNPSDVTFFEILLKYGANPNTPSPSSSTNWCQRPLVAILFRLHHGSHVLPFLKLLLDYGADPNFPKNTINSICYTDIDMYCVEALQLALQAGARPNNPINNLGWLPINGLKARA